VDLMWADLAQPLIGGLAGMLGVYVMEEGLRVLRRRGICPESWRRDRTFLTPREGSGQRLR
jgi:hypothetical protein